MAPYINYNGHCCSTNPLYQSLLIRLLSTSFFLFTSISCGYKNILLNILHKHIVLIRVVKIKQFDKSEYIMRFDWSFILHLNSIITLMQCSPTFAEYTYVNFMDNPYVVFARGYSPLSNASLIKIER